MSEFPRWLQMRLKNYQVFRAVPIRRSSSGLVAKNGQITDTRTFDAKAQPWLSWYTTRWVLDHWQFKPDVTGVFTMPTTLFQTRTNTIG
jgi:hypothetical protein